ncbi:MAG: NADH pyrophosphatase [Alphaproteobacteria bacterium MarineAlpha12_Bin1]|jgi:NAD+ diphosphatase|nr:MAG: NADH pyrophosphatase [Alphaproteobacteria bacterium MarineAlpha12_Bin1]|tara:strand:+ start:6844 stop:7788 length:945 start_codon:yes stop_codon:yes gene_type:complete
MRLSEFTGDSLMNSKNFYATVSLDRQANRRSDTAWINGKLNSQKSRILPVWRDQSLVSTGKSFTAAYLTHESLQSLELKDKPIFLGSLNDYSYFCVDLSHLDLPIEEFQSGIDNDFIDLRQIGGVMSPDEANLLAYARGINYWHKRNVYCGVCGKLTIVEESGHQRRCKNKKCNTIQFPRTDSACIVLVHNGDKIILARADRFPPKMQSVLAGFLEPGESLEDCVAREVFEEVGIHLTDIHYRHSQPWPFPSSLMVGFRARAVSFDLRPDEKELVSADWFTRRELKAITPESDIQLPRKDSIARRLIDEWLEED